MVDESQSSLAFHYTDRAAYNSIRSQATWTFRATQPPGDHPFGAYFTILPPDTPKLAKKLGIPRVKLKYVFVFRRADSLKRLRGERGEFILYHPDDYNVEAVRQLFHGVSEEYRELGP